MQNLEEFISSKSSPVSISDPSVPQSLIKQIQQLLKIEVDGLVGPLTKQAFSEFKSNNNLEYPLLLGPTTAKELLELKDKSEESANEDSSDTEPTSTDPFMLLPDGNKVYSSTRVIDKVPLTWGELTKDCSRVPTCNEYVNNAIKLVKTWAIVREKFGSEIRITSGYRPVAVNRAIGGALNSQHIYFRAIDMAPVNGDFKRLWQILQESSFTGLGDGVKKGFYHADIRPGSRIIFPY